MKKLLKYLLYTLILGVLLFIGFIVTAGIKDYSPKEIIVVATPENPTILPDTLRFSVVTWNIGYCGLSADMDFFYDGGEQVRTSKEITEQNLFGISNFIKSKNDVNFFLLQEVDKNSKRSYYINEVDTLNSVCNYYGYFGKNYDTFMVPMPIHNPYGKVVGGLLTLSEYQSAKVERRAFPSSYSIPKKYFMLDRCFLVSRYKLSNGKELIIINTHNSAYDDGSMKLKEMNYLKDFVMAEYKQGNYIVVGGDWNQCPPNFDKKVAGYVFDTKKFSQIDPNFMPNGWKWIFDGKSPTNRRIDTIWDKKTSRTTVIDYFLISPNVANISIQNIAMDFKYSDHNPVIGTFVLRE
ncbi:MAG: hypothetical protein KGV44_07300 [Flavobacteriaceae bacterium]|nr:hypothetical protein [Flavobacteriaceae bacterium]